MLSAQSSLATAPEDNADRSDPLAWQPTLQRTVPERDHNTVPPLSRSTRVTTPAANKIASRSSGAPHACVGMPTSFPVQQPRAPTTKEVND